MGNSKVIEREELIIADSSEEVIPNDKNSITLYKGMKHSNIKDLKSKLNSLGFGELKVDNYFGDFAEQKIRLFQSHYGLEINGIADMETLDKIEELFNSPYQFKRHHDDLIPLKKKLNWIGYGPIKVTDYFGATTEKQVKRFQKDHNIPASGIIDDITAARIEEVLSDIYRLGSKHEQIAELKSKLNRIGFKGIKVTDFYGPFLEKRVKEFQSYYGLPTTGNVNYETLNKIDMVLSSPLQVGKMHEDVITLKRNLFTLGYGYVKTTKKFGNATEKELKRFQKDYDLPVSGIADELTLTKINTALNYNEKVSYTEYPITFEEALEIQLKSIAQRDNDKYVNQKDLEPDVAIYLNPIAFINNEKEKFQFLNLSKSKVVDSSVLNNFLHDKGDLEKLGEVFIEAGNINSVNELFLVSIALLETNNGSSILANGVPVNEKGEITFINTKIDGEERIEPGETEDTVKIVYNIFGINDKKSHNIDESVKKAFEEDWDTPQKAIIDGAKFIKDNYIGDNNTFYKMRWQPDYMSEIKEAGIPVSDDLNWASKQVEGLYNIYNQLESYQLYLDIPVYKNQPNVKYRRG
ncbi:peptidoglycan-binding protein [Oceanobacillus caeni]|uniref:peptidoglycan-binding protein n=1 Tax=Oceanobacillus caeni TaxID=405946 RepID=UPI002E1A7B5C|nr:peptidoglycan-binding protein [Oceanobacillus caeni]